ncbi:hypothetical protein [Lentzea cavernae]|uniref:Uncharacterized protein n=1 Tax=Lentzea cavernae TaxID=2020703 RepID=A0ABQ3MRF6_9PSEU|nr:hypothetical protein [Lentzea cavernae]GHH57435.1 hypothetical protein GCM10017774_76920 [Lentzea cavernae]
MTWFRIDDKFAEHPKVRRLAKDRVPAVGLWTLCGVWCADNTTDGFVPTEVVRRHDPRLRLAKRLVEVRLWHEVEREGEVGFEFHQWSEHQPTKEEIDEKRRKTAAKVKAWRARKAAQRLEELEEYLGEEPECNPVTREVTNQVRNPAPDPTRPVSTSPDGEVPPSLRSGETRPRAQTAKKAKASRIPSDFTVTAEMVEWAREKTPLVGRAETENFVDYWTAATKNASKLDWVAAWRTWMRRAQADAEARQPRRPALNGNHHGTVSGSARMDKALSALVDDDPYLTQYATQQPVEGLLVIEGGRTA